MTNGSNLFRRALRPRQAATAAAVALLLATGPARANAPVPPDPVVAVERLVLHPRADVFTPGPVAYAVPPDFDGRIRAYATARRAALTIPDPIDRAAALVYAETRFQQAMGRVISHRDLDRINALLGLR